LSLNYIEIFKRNYCNIFIVHWNWTLVKRSYKYASQSTQLELSFTIIMAPIQIKRELSHDRFARKLKKKSVFLYVSDNDFLLVHKNNELLMKNTFEKFMLIILFTKKMR